MLIKEYRIRMPLSVEEYKTAQLYMVSRFSRERTTKGEGIEILVNEPFENEKGKGQFTHKRIHLGGNLPAWVKAVLPTYATIVEEKAWNAYPYVKNEYICPMFGERFSIIMETRYFDDDGSQTNVFNLDEATLKQREVEFIDIATDEVVPHLYKPEEDPKLFTSKKTNRGPLAKDWHLTQKPLMTIYKIAYVEFKVWGLQTKGEQWLQKAMVHDVLTLGHKQAFCWIDNWYGMTMEELRAYEAETKLLLDKALKGEDGGASNEQKAEQQTPAVQQ